MGIPQSFIQLTKLLFTDAEAVVCVNGVNTKKIPVRQGVRQGCPLAPYLFLVVGEALNAATKKMLVEGELAGIKLPEGSGEQIISQYDDDVNFTILAEERIFKRLALLLERYGLASGLVINWTKSLVYWLSPEPAPNWLDQMECPWAIEHQLSKLLGSLSELICKPLTSTSF